MVFGGAQSILKRGGIRSLAPVAVGVVPRPVLIVTFVNTIFGVGIPLCLVIINTELLCSPELI